MNCIDKYYLLKFDWCNFDFVDIIKNSLEKYSDLIIRLEKNTNFMDIAVCM